MKPLVKKQTKAPTRPYKEKTLPITWTGWDMVDTMHISFLDVVFTEDFGPVKKAEQFVAISFNMGTGVIFTYDPDGEIIHEIEVQIIPIAS